MYSLAAQAEARRDARGFGLGRRPEHVVVDPVIGDVEPGRVGVDQPDELVAGRLRRHDAAGRALHRRSDRRPVERTTGRRVEIGLAEERRVVDRRDDRAARTHRHRVVRRVNDVRTDVFGDERQPGLLPGDARGSVRERRRPGYDLPGGHQPAVPLGVDPLAHHSEVGVHLRECRRGARRRTARAHPGRREQQWRRPGPVAPRCIHLERSMICECAGPVRSPGRRKLTPRARTESGCDRRSRVDAGRMTPVAPRSAAPDTSVVATVVVVAWNGAHLLDACLDAVVGTAARRRLHHPGDRQRVDRRQRGRGCRAPDRCSGGEPGSQHRLRRSRRDGRT